LVIDVGSIVYSPICALGKFNA